MRKGVYRSAIKDATGWLDSREAPLGEVLWGARQIGQAIGRTQRQAHHLLRNGRIPATKLGVTWVSTRTRLLATFESREGNEGVKA